MSIFQRIHERRCACVSSTAFSPRIYSKAWILTAIFLVAVASLGFSQSDPLVVSPDGSIAVNGPLTINGHISLNVNGVSMDLIDYLVPVGSIHPFAGSTAPQGWALCNGHAVLSTEHQYDRLYAIIGTAFGNGTTEDGHAASGYFNLPDLREAAPAGVGSRPSGVAAHDTFTLGQFKDDQMQGHYHRVGWGSGAPFSISGTRNTTGSSVVSATPVLEAVSDGANGTPRTGVVTRGKRIGVNFIVKY